jgi:hypothetical protein
MHVADSGHPWVRFFNMCLMGNLQHACRRFISIFFYVGNCERLLSNTCSVSID